MLIVSMQHRFLASRGSRCDMNFTRICMLITEGNLISVNAHVHIFTDSVIIFYTVLRRMSVQIIKWYVIFDHRECKKKNKKK